MSGIRQDGNVLFIVLIAVALFAALSFAVGATTRNGTSNSSKETTTVNVSAILNHVSDLQAAIPRMKLVNGCDDSQLNFTNPIYKTGHSALTMAANSNAPVSGKCNVYSRLGGNVVPIIFPLSARGTKDGNNAVTLPGNASLAVTQYKNIGTDAASGTASANDLAIEFYNPTLAVCLALNDALGVTNPSGVPPTLTTVPGQHGGSYASGSFDTDGISSGTYTNGKFAHCTGSAGTYIFTVILLAR